MLIYAVFDNQRAAQRQKNKWSVRLPFKKWDLFPVHPLPKDFTEYLARFSFLLWLVGGGESRSSFNQSITDNTSKVIRVKFNCCCGRSRAACLQVTQWQLFTIHSCQFIRSIATLMVGNGFLWIFPLLLSRRPCISSTSKEREMHLLCSWRRPFQRP